jgi:hypothetical protein
MRESFTSGTVGGASGNRRIYPELCLIISPTQYIAVAKKNWRIVDLIIKPSKSANLKFNDIFGDISRFKADISNHKL